jgi:hypothetical protein
MASKARLAELLKAKPAAKFNAAELRELYQGIWPGTDADFAKQYNVDTAQLSAWVRGRSGSSAAQNTTTTAVGQAMRRFITEVQMMEGIMFETTTTTVQPPEELPQPPQPQPAAPKPKPVKPKPVQQQPPAMLTASCKSMGAIAVEKARDAEVQRAVLEAKVAELETTAAKSTKAEKEAATKMQELRYMLLCAEAEVKKASVAAAKAEESRMLAMRDRRTQDMRVAMLEAKLSESNQRHALAARRCAELEGVIAKLTSTLQQQPSLRMVALLGMIVAFVTFTICMAVFSC